MSVQRFDIVLTLAKIEDNDRIWFQRWLSRYAVFLRLPESVSLPVSLHMVKQFCRMLLATETRAWQRLQAETVVQQTETVFGKGTTSSQCKAYYSPQHAHRAK